MRGSFESLYGELCGLNIESDQRNRFYLPLLVESRQGSDDRRLTAHARGHVVADDELLCRERTTEVIAVAHVEFYVCRVAPAKGLTVRANDPSPLLPRRAA